MIKALLFDMDGVLADTEDASITIGIEYFKTKGVDASKEDFEPYLGCGERLFFDGTASRLKVRDYSYEEASAFFRERYPEMLSRLYPALPGIEIVQRAKSAGILTAVASSAPRWKVEANIRAIGLALDSFDFIASGENIRRNKPSGDIYRLCLASLGVDSSDAIVFEDTAGGIEAGEDAGCRTVALMTTIDGESASQHNPYAVISDLSAIASFDSASELESMLDSYSSSSSEQAVYGANYISRNAHTLPESFVEKRAIDIAWKAWKNAYVPYSHFPVGAAIVSAATGRIYPGCNVENSSFGGTICAERNAITTAVAAEGAIGIDLVVVVSADDPPAPPCAICRQVLSEFCRSETKLVLLSTNGKIARYSFGELLPHPFVMPNMRK